jgi:hypothetical protein
MAAPTIKYLVADDMAGVPAYSASGTFATSAGVYPPVPFGMEVRFKDNQTGSGNAGGCVGVMCQGSNVTAAGQFVQVVSNSAILLDSANSASFYPIGIAGAPMSATNVWGFVGLEGLFDNGAFTNVSFAANARVALASTAGQIGSVTALGSGIRGIILPVSFTSSQTNLTVQLARPFIVGITASN